MTAPWPFIIPARARVLVFGSDDPPSHSAEVAEFLTLIRNGQFVLCLHTRGDPHVKRRPYDG